MKLNGLNCIQYGIDGNNLRLVLLNATAEDAASLANNHELVLLDDVGNPAVSFYDFYTLHSIEQNFSQNTVTTILNKRTNMEKSVLEVEEENKLLKAKLNAVIQNNQTFEECIVELATVVYN